MKTNLLALGLILSAAVWRVAIVYQPAFYNVAPVTALAFCGALYFRDQRMWLVPFGAILLSDLWLNHYHATEFGYTWPRGAMLLRLTCFAAALGIGRLVARRPRWLPLLGGALSCSFLFYLATNTAAWAEDAYYAKSLAGWWQALTIGHPEFPCTLWFFRNTLLGDLVFTILFAAAVKSASARAKALQRV